jgi:starch phosphorylase
VAFLADYDLDLTSHLVQGVDLWLNTPRRPWEASGTSGMKVLVNGGLNLSELDGWWAEAYSPEVGWAIGDGQEHGGDPNWDAHEANALYEVLEKQVIPAFYNRDQRGIPPVWVKMMRASMVQLTPRFSSNRAVREYVEKYYLPAAAAYSCRTENEGLLGVKLTNWSKSIAQQWSNVRFGKVTIRERDSEHVFEVWIALGRLDPGDVDVQLYAEPRADGAAFRQKMSLVQAPQGSVGDSFLYTATVPATRPASEYTPRVIPFHPNASVPIEASEILWEH